MAKPTICLNMIVKNEAHVIRRCVDSVRPLIDTWAIVDTGSTDGTQDVIREALKDLPGELHERPWKGFGPSRSEAIELGRGKADYLLFIDADDYLEYTKGFALPKLEKDVYDFQLRHAQIRYWRAALVTARLPWRYVGVLHEYLDCGHENYSRGRVEGVTIAYTGTGGRSQVDQRTKFLRDAELLEKGLLDEPDNSRYVFYLGQSYRDADEHQKSIAAYDRRATMGGFPEEVYCSHLYAARQAAKIGRPDAEVIDRFLRAHESRPQRGEAIGELARWFREKGQRWPLAYLFAKQAVQIRRPDDVLFVEPDWYEWRALDELGVAAYWVGEYAEAKSTCEKLLKGSALPQAHRARIVENLNFARRKLGLGDVKIS